MTERRPDALRLLGPDLRALPAVHPANALRPGQARALARSAAGADVLVHAAPRAGRTALALTAAAQGEDTLLLAPRRAAAARLRDALAVHGADQARVMTPAALGFALVRADATRRGLGEPTLVTGADQDSLLAELIAQRSDWHLDVDPAARTLPGFRTELRDLVTRATELGLGPDALEELGRERSRPAWRDAAALLRDYLGVLDLESATALDAGPRLDSGGLVRRGARLLAADGAPLPAPLVVVDDAQDLTSAGVALVLALAGAGARLLVTACADEAVDTFRGALPDAAARLVEGLHRPPVTEVLEDDAPGAAGITAAVDALRARLPLAGAPAVLRRPRTDAAALPELPGVTVLRARSGLDEARLIASALRDLHHREQVPYDDMAVVCRSGAAVAEVADLLARAGLPVRVPHRPRPLREEAVVADLLRIVEIGLAPAEAVPDPLEALELLRGPYGDADQLRLRRIRRLLLAARPEGDETPGEELLARALVEEEAPGLPAADARDRAAAPMHRLRAMIAAVRSRRGEGAQEVLWAAWDAAALAGGWRRAALGAPEDVDGARARLAAGRLDALLALFAAAERLADRRPGAGPLDLVEQVRAQAVVEDTLAASATPRGRLAVLTPTQLAGEDRDTVALARVQEGAWPNLRLRSTLFGAAELSLVGTARPGQEPPAEVDTLLAAQRAQVLADELRLAVSALSRARTRVLVTAVDDAELTPSALHEVLADLDLPAWTDAEELRKDPGPAPDLRSLVSSLRRRLREEDEATARDAATALAALHAAGAPGADPADWYHQHPTSTDPLQDPGTPVPLSPSALERAHDCPRAWLFERAGGSRASGPAQVLGTAVHRLAQEDPRGESGEEDLLARLHTLLRGVPGLDTWSGRRRVRRAEDAARLLAEHLRTVAGEPLAIEAPFTVDLPGPHPVQLRGTMDRVEGDGGGLRVVDLKTGAPKSKAAAAEDLQLAAYQTAVRGGALAEQLGPDAPDRLGGAELVYLGGGGRKAAVRGQGAFETAEDPAWFERLVGVVAEEVSGTRVIARPNAHCPHCAVRASCPLQPEGSQL